MFCEAGLTEGVRGVGVSKISEDTSDELTARLFAVGNAGLLLDGSEESSSSSNTRLSGARDIVREDAGLIVGVHSEVASLV